MPPRPTHVMDACAGIAYLKGDQGILDLPQILGDERNSVVIHAVNLCEVYYDFLRSDGQLVADEAHASIIRVVNVIEDAAEDFLKRVARWKVGHVCPGHTLGIADAFAAATAEQYACRLVTSDHRDFDPIEQAGALSILWSR